MYFAEPLASLITPPDAPGSRPIQRHSPTLFTAGKSAVIIRYAGPRELAYLARTQPERVYYVIDDALHAAAPGDGLPADYRRKLVAFRDGPLGSLLPFISHVVAPSRAILAGYPGKAGLLLEPAQTHDQAGLSHHGKEQHFEIVVPGTRAHQRDLGHIARGLAQFLRETPEAKLTTFLGEDAPRSLRDLGNASHLRPLSWLEYRKFVAENRFHVALAPLLDTAFNRARSMSKLHDHAGFGAAGLYSDREPFRGLVRPDASGLLLADDPAHWLAALRRLKANRTLTQRLALGGQGLSARHGSLAQVRAFWLDVLSIQQ
jgi:hypothetical protein